MSCQNTTRKLGMDSTRQRRRRNRKCRARPRSRHHLRTLNPSGYMFICRKGVIAIVLNVFHNIRLLPTMSSTRPVILGTTRRFRNCAYPVREPEANGVEGDESPLNISVRYVTKPTGYYYPDWGNSSILLPRYAERCLLGYTPLSAAVFGRRWSTAKLILAIAAAQYDPGENDEKIEFNINVIGAWLS
jgi:hypothetical protein